MADYTVFKNSDGIFYGVSQRIIDMGYTPEEGVVLASEEETVTFLEGLKRTGPTITKDQYLSTLKEMSDSGIDTTVFDKLVDNFPDTIEPEPVIPEVVEPEPATPVEPEPVIPEPEPIVIPEPVPEISRREQVRLKRENKRGTE